MTTQIPVNFLGRLPSKRSTVSKSSPCISLMREALHQAGTSEHSVWGKAVFAGGLRAQKSCAFSTVTG